MWVLDRDGARRVRGPVVPNSDPRPRVCVDDAPGVRGVLTPVPDRVPALVVLPAENVVTRSWAVPASPRRSGRRRATPGTMRIAICRAGRPRIRTMTVMPIAAARIAPRLCVKSSPGTRTRRHGHRRCNARKPTSSRIAFAISWPTGFF